MDPFDRHMRALFQDREIPIDTGTIWAKIEPTLPTGGPISSRWAAWKKWLWSLILIAIASLGVWLYQKGESIRHNQSASNRSAASLSSPVVTLPSGTPNVQHEDKDPSLAPRPSNTHPVLPSKEERGNPSAIKDHYASEEDNTRRKAVRPPIQLPSAPLLTPTANSLTAGDLGRERASLPTVFSKTFITSTLIPSHTNISPPTAPAPPERSGTNTRPPTLIHPLPSIGSYPPIGLNKEGHALHLPGLSQKPRDCYDFSLKVWRHELDVYIGPDYTPIRFVAKNNEEEQYANLRRRTESGLESFSAGVQYNLRHRRGFFIGLGLNFSQIDEKFELQSLQTDTAFRNGVVRIEIDSLGNEHKKTGQKRIYKITQWDKRTYNYYRFISIPVVIGYGFSLWHMGVEPSVGVDINLLFRKKGEVLLPNGLPGYITDGHPKEVDIYKKWAGLGITGGLKLVYPFRDRWDLFAEPYARFPIQSINVPSYALDQKRTTYGLRLGARIKL